MNYFKSYKKSIQNIKKKGGGNPAYSKEYAYFRYRKRLLEIA